MNVLIALSLIALGMSLDALYQHKIRVAECDARSEEHTSELQSR